MFKNKKINYDNINYIFFLIIVAIFCVYKLTHIDEKESNVKIQNKVENDINNNTRNVIENSINNIINNTITNNTMNISNNNLLSTNVVINETVENTISSETKFSVDEVSINGVKQPFTKDKIISLYGNPINVTENPMDLIWEYEGIKFQFSNVYDDYSSDTALEIDIENNSINLSRNIKVGDSFENVLKKFPQEYNYLDNKDGFFYGGYQGAYDGINQFGGLVHEDKSTIAVWDQYGYMHINFENNKVISINIRMAHCGI